MPVFDTATPVAFVQVTDRERGLSFYRDTLGLAHRSSDDFGDFLACNDALMRLTALPDWKPSGHPTIGWDVPDIAAAVAALKAKGVAMTIYDGMGQDADGVWRAPDGKTAVAWFADPDGNVLSLSETAPKP